MRLLPFLIGGVMLLLVAMVAVLFLVVLPGSGPRTGGGSGDDGGNNDQFLGYIDSEARIEIEALQTDVQNLHGDIENLQVQIATLESAVRAIGKGAGTDVSVLGEEFYDDGNNELIDKYTQVVFLQGRTDINAGLTVAQPSYLIEKLGMPREDLNDNCQEMTNQRLKDALVTEQVGPVRVTMLRPAIESLKRVFANIQANDPDLYKLINTAGSLCVRRIRGTSNAVSTHSFGLAVDLNVDGRLDTFADGKTQLGLTLMGEYFNAEGWVWGAGFNREDSMHFEVSKRQLDEWIAAGEL